MIIQIFFFTAVTFVPVLIIISLPIFAELVLVGGGNGFALFQELVAVLTDLIAGVALVELAGLLGIYDGFLMIADVFLFAAVTFVPVLLIIGLPFFTEIMLVGRRLLDGEIVGEEILLTGIIGLENHEVESNHISVLQRQLIAGVGNGGAAVAFDLVSKGGLGAPNVLTFGEMVDNT